MQMQNVIPKIRLNKFSRELKQLDMVVQFEKNMPHAVLMYRPKRRLTKRHQLRIVKLKYQQKTKFVHLNLSGIADVLWLATDGLENTNLQHGELIWLDFHHICLNKTFSSGLLKKSSG